MFKSNSMNYLLISERCLPARGICSPSAELGPSVFFFCFKVRNSGPAVQALEDSLSLRKLT